MAQPPTQRIDLTGFGIDGSVFGADCASTTTERARADDEARAVLATLCAPVEAADAGDSRSGG